MGYIIAIVCMVLADQGCKHFVTVRYGFGGHADIIGNFLSLDVIQNSGVAFGMFEHAQQFIIVFTSFLSGAILVYILLRRKSARKTVLVPLSMIAGGAVGNLIDRLRQGFVTDFIHFHIWPYVFNVADALIVIGCIVLLIAVIFPSFGNRGRNRRHGR